jgi:hypothetical protein
MSQPTEPEQPEPQIDRDDPTTWCAPWCDKGPECHAADPGTWEDRATCFGPEHHLPLSRYPSELTSEGTYEPDYVVLYAMRDRPGPPPYVWLARNEGAALLELTPREAAGLRDSLTGVLEEIGYTTD